MKKMSNFVAMSLVLALLMTGCSGKIKEKIYWDPGTEMGEKMHHSFCMMMVPAKLMGSMALEHGAL